MKLPFALLAVLLMSTPAGRAFTILSDDTFNDADWDLFSAGSTGGSTNAVTQDATPGWGNPSPYRQMVHFLPCTSDPCPGPSGTPSTIGVNHRYLAVGYDPSVAGAIHHLNVRMDRIVFSITPDGPGQGVGNGFRVYQGGNAYFAGSETFTNRAWATQSLPNLAAADFSGGGPDFSAAGAPLQFGYFRSNSNTGQGADATLVHGLDNFTVEIYSTTDNDLALTKTASTANLVLGSDLTYTLTVDNIGAVTATSVTLTDALPANVTFVSATPSQGSSTQIAGVVTCELGALAAGATATVTVIVTPTLAGSFTNNAGVTATEPDVQPGNNTATTVTSVHADGNDLTCQLDAVFGACVDTAKGPACPVDAQLLLRNNGVVYGDAVVILTNTCKITTVPAKCKLQGTLVVNELDLTGLPDHALAFYLSSDTVLDADDFPMKSIGLSKALSSFIKGKAVKLSLKLPKGVDLTGQHILVVVDAPDKKGFDAVVETNEDNNTAASPPLPALP